MAPVDTPARPATTARAPVVVAAVVAAALLGLVIALVVSLDRAAFVDRITVVNPTDYDVNVDVRSAEGDGWLDLGTVERGREATFEEVADQGDQWLFRFSYAGTEAGELVVARDDLAGRQWTLEIPAEVGLRLQTAGVAPTAR
jgi:hypothetical protein